MNGGHEDHLDMMRLFRGPTGFVKRAQAQISRQGMGR